MKTRNKKGVGIYEILIFVILMGVFIGVAVVITGLSAGELAFLGSLIPSGGEVLFCSAPKIGGGAEGMRYWNTESGIRNDLEAADVTTHNIKTEAICKFLGPSYTSCTEACRDRGYWGGYMREGKVMNDWNGEENMYRCQCYKDSEPRTWYCANAFGWEKDAGGSLVEIQWVEWTPDEGAIQGDPSYTYYDYTEYYNPVLTNECGDCDTKCKNVGYQSGRLEGSQTGDWATEGMDMKRCVCDGDWSNPDPDGDGLTNVDEDAYGTDKNNPDSDGDGWYDGFEAEAGTDPMDEDTDGDGVKDSEDNSPLDYSIQ